MQKEIIIAAFCVSILSFFTGSILTENKKSVIHHEPKEIIKAVKETYYLLPKEKWEVKFYDDRTGKPTQFGLIDNSPHKFNKACKKFTPGG